MTTKKRPPARPSQRSGGGARKSASLGRSTKKKSRRTNDSPRQGGGSSQASAQRGSPEDKRSSDASTGGRPQSRRSRGSKQVNSPTAAAPPRRRGARPSSLPPPSSLPATGQKRRESSHDADEGTSSERTVTQLGQSQLGQSQLGQSQLGQSQLGQGEPPPSGSDSPPSSSQHADDLGMLGIGSRVLPPDMDLDLFEDEVTERTERRSSEASVASRIRELEEQLDGMMRSSKSTSVVSRRGSSDEAEDQTEDESIDESTAVEAAKELLESRYYRHKWGRISLRDRAEDVDDFGLDPDFESRLRPLLEFLFKRYFRVETRGIDNIPSEGRGIIVANHSGTLPLDGPMLREALRLHHPASRDLRWLAEDFTFYLPFLGVTMNRIGAVRACQENAARLIEGGRLLAVFPEGAKGIRKLYHQRYQLQRFGRGGFIRLCLRTRSPLIPCAIVGAEETNPMLYRFDNASKLLGLQYLPVTPTFPWLGPLGLIPAPTKWRITFGEPIDLSNYGPGAADDHVLVGRLSDRVRTTISSMLDGSLRSRRSIWT